MFYVYDVDGLQFKGPMEALEQNRKVEKSDAVKPLKFDDQLAQYPSGAKGKAVATYQKMIQRESMVEPLVHIYQIMSTPVSTINPDISLIDAWAMLKDGNFRQLVVTNNKREVVGLLSDRDVLRYLNVAGDTIQILANLNVSQVIKEETITTDSMSDIRRVARVMAYYHLDAMPVLEKEMLVGVVTRGDILRGFAENPKLNLWA